MQSALSPPPATHPDTAPGEMPSAEDTLGSAFDCLDSGDASGAVSVLRTAVAAGCRDADVRALLAELVAADGYAAEAVVLYRDALADQPDRLMWRRGLATALEVAGDLAGAADSWRAILSDRPDDAASHRHLARLLATAGETEAAIGHAREARALGSGDLADRVDLAETFLTAGEPLESVELLEPALRRAEGEDGLTRARITLGRAWSALGEERRALDLLRRALQDDPDDPHGVGALIAGIEGGAAGFTPVFVRSLFDRYADRFERDLVERLAYAGPRLIADALATLGLVADGTLSVMDAGCGTGLAGPVLRPFAAELVGVDLSPRMLAKAERRDLYDTLVAGDLLAVLAAEMGTRDLIVAADVLLYFGDLGPVMRAVAGALRPGGRFVFTVEHLPGDGVLLQESRRYAHGTAHVLAAAVTAGLDVLLESDAVLRIDRGSPVAGRVFALRRPV